MCTGGGWRCQCAVAASAAVAAMTVGNKCGGDLRMCVTVVRLRLNLYFLRPYRRRGSRLRFYDTLPAPGATTAFLLVSIDGRTSKGHRGPVYPIGLFMRGLFKRVIDDTGVKIE